jgi:hypothetical protein
MKKYSYKKIKHIGWFIWASFTTFLACLVFRSFFYNISFWKIGIIFLGGYYWCMFISYIVKIKGLE